MSALANLQARREMLLHEIRITRATAAAAALDIRMEAGSLLLGVSVARLFRGGSAGRTVLGIAAGALAAWAARALWRTQSSTGEAR